MVNHDNGWKKPYGRLKKLSTLGIVFSILSIIAAFVMAAGSNGWQLRIDFEEILRSKGSMETFFTACFFLFAGVFILIVSIRTKRQLRRISAIMELDQEGQEKNRRVEAVFDEKDLNEK